MTRRPIRLAGYDHWKTTETDEDEPWVARHFLCVRCGGLFPWSDGPGIHWDINVCGKCWEELRS